MQHQTIDREIQSKPGRRASEDSPLANFARGFLGPVTVVFGTFNYRELVIRWVGKVT